MLRLGMNLNWYGGIDGKFSDQTTEMKWTLNGAIVPPGPLPVGAVRQAVLTCYPGQHTLKATGKGSLAVYFGGGVKDPGNLIPAGKPNLYTATFAAGSEVYSFTPVSGRGRTIGLTVQAVDARTPFTVVQVLAPGADGSSLYHPAYLAGLAPFAVIRTMDPQQIVASKERYWADRNTQYGHDLEALCALGNQLGRDLWMNIPARAVSANAAPTDWCYQFGDLLNACLSPGRTVYLEFTNECWNFGNPFWVSTDDVFNQAPYEYESIGPRAAYARFADKAFRAVASRIGADGPKLKRVFAGQLANVGTIDPSLPWAVSQGYHFDCLAGGLYWPMAGDAVAIKAAWVAGDQAGALKLVDDGYRAGAATMMKSVQQYASYAAKYGLELVGYEGGPGGTSLYSYPDTLPIMKAYVHSTLCEQTHVDILSQLDGAGVSLLCYYSFRHPDPTWSSQDSPADLTSGRYRGLRHFLAGASPALFAGPDTATQGSWVGTYGSLGAIVAGAPMPQPPPPSAQASTVPVPGGKLLTYQAPGTTTDPKAPLLPDGSGGRVAAIWYDAAGFTIDVPAPAAGGPYLLSVYCLDWQTGDGYAQSVSILDGDTGTVLDTQPAAKLTTRPAYLRWAVEGHVKVQVTRTGGYACAVSGVFLDPVPSP